MKTCITAIASVASAALTLVALTPAVRADVTSLAIGSAAVPPGTTVGVDVVAQATDPGIGAWVIDVRYDPVLLTLKECRPAAGSALCNPDYGADTVRLVGADASGLKGGAVLGGLTFEAGQAEGEAVLDLMVTQLADPDANEIAVSPTGGTITIKLGITASIGPTSTAGGEPLAPGEGGSASSAAASGAAQAVDQAEGGGASSGGSGGSNTPAWLLAGAGLAAVGGGVWIATRMRKQP